MQFVIRPVVFEAKNINYFNKIIRSILSPCVLTCINLYILKKPTETQLEIK